MEGATKFGTRYPRGEDDAGMLSMHIMRARAEKACDTTLDDEK